MNDHSYKAGQAAFTENIKMTVYVKGVLVYGQEPTGAAVRQSNQEVVTGEKESLSSKEEISGLTVKALNNPVTGNEATFIVKAAPGERVQVILADVSGKVIGKMEFIQSSPEERKSISFRNTVQGMLFLKVNTQKETKTIQLLASVGNYGH
ncbi:MAG: T9SS type A sorting domain-containing protein [Bacteroidota bacterium]